MNEGKSFVWSKLTDNAGVAGSLTRGPFETVYIGGNMKFNGKWNLSIFIIDDGFGREDMASKYTRLVITTDSTCSIDEWGHSDENSAPYISHLGFMNAETGNQVFGLTSSTNFDGSGLAQPYAFRILAYGAILATS